MNFIQQVTPTDWLIPRKIYGSAIIIFTFQLCAVWAKMTRRSIADTLDKLKEQKVWTESEGDR